MAQKVFELKGIGPVLVAKRRGSKNLRLSLNAAGKVRVSQPYWLPYEAGLRYATSKQDWLKQHQAKHLTINPKDGDLVGKSYRLKLDSSGGRRPTSRLIGAQLHLSLPANLTAEAKRQAIAAAFEKALKRDSQNLLTFRVKQLSQRHGYTYRSLKFRKMTSRWGSCSSRRDITLSIYLIQLPWQLIDYVVLHELTHTELLNHGPAFWQRLTDVLPEARQLQKRIRNYRPSMAED